MKFDELCKFVLINEADVDYLTKKGLVFSLTPDAEEIARGLELSDVKELIRKTTLPFTREYLIRLVTDDLVDYLPAESQDFKKMLMRNIWITFDDTEKKSNRAAAILFAFLKKKKIIQQGIKKDDVNDEDLEKLSKDLSSGTDIDFDDDSTELSMSDVTKLGGRIDRLTGHPEDDSLYHYGD